MRDTFDYETYWWILQRLSRTNRPVCFADLRDGFPPEPFFILRHDVDYSTAAALRMAELESRRRIRATYFLLPNCFYYNLLNPEHAVVPRRLVELGHEVGLHYDLNFFLAFPRTRWEELLALQASLLGQLSGIPVVSIAMHQPGLNGEDPFRRRSDFLNVYDDRFFREMPYVSDSCRAWTDASWKLFESETLPTRLQVAFHPINWSENDRDRTSIFKSVHHELKRSVEMTCDDLLGKIGKHSGVLEHERRAARSQGRGSA